MDTVRQSRRLGIIGSVVGLVALLASALTHLLPAAHLSRPVAGQATEEAAPSKDHLILRTKRLEIKSHGASEQRPAGITWDQVLSTTAVSLGLLAIALAVFAAILREEKLLAGVAAVLGVAAIAVQVWWVLIIGAIVIALINSILF